MSGKYLSRNEKASTRASKNNLWIRYQKKWYHPDEFKYRFESGMGVKPSDVELLNPMPFLKQGREMIKGMVRVAAPIASILNALNRLYEFEDKLMKFGFREREGQINAASWPDEEPSEFKSKWEQDREAEKYKLPDPIDYDAIDPPHPE